MADVTIKRIDQLPAASTPQGTDLLPLWQGNQTTKVPLSNIQASGPAGKDGVSPTVEVSKSGTQTTITITDAQGKHTATINDGAAVDELNCYPVGTSVAEKYQIMLRYGGKDVLAKDLPIAYHGGEVTFANEFEAVKIEGNVLYLGY